MIDKADQQTLATWSALSFRIALGGAKLGPTPYIPEVQRILQEMPSF